MDPLFDLEGKIIVVTGGLGQLGRQYSCTLLARGARVVVLDLGVSPERVKERFGDLAESDNLLVLEADVTNKDSLDAALARINQDWGLVYGLVNNAALDSPPDSPAEENGPFETYPVTSFERVMDVNVKGVFLCCQVFGAQMAEAGQGTIVNINSIYGALSPNQDIYEYRRQAGETFFKPVAYSVSKSALYNLTRYLATYWAKQGVRVNTMTLAGIFNHQDETFLANYTPKVPLGRMANEDDYNGALVFLLSGASAYMTGSNLVIDGGWTAW